MTLLQSSSALDRRARGRSFLAEIPPCALMALSACKIRRGCNVLQVPILIIPLGVLPLGGAIPSVADQNCDGSLRNILRNEPALV